MMSEGQYREHFERRLLRVLAYIHDNLDGDLSLDRLAEIACMSRFHWHRVFQAMTGETLAETIRRLRMLKAANALVLEDVPVAEIAARHGYPNLASFSRAFTAINGLSPGAFRRRGIQLSNDLLSNEGESTMFPVTIEELPARKVVGVTHTGPYIDVGKAFHRLSGIIAARSLFAHIRGMAGIYHDAPGSKPDAELRSQAVMLVSDEFPAGIEGLDYFELPAGRYAVMAHKGPYATLASAYEWLYGKWLPQSGEEPRDAPPIEFYVNDPANTQPEDLRTDVCLPLV